MGYNTYLKLDGVAGECTEEEHRGWMALDSFSHSVCGQQPNGGQVTMSDLSISKFVDRSTPLVARATAEGKVFRDAVIELCRADGSKAKFMELRMTKVRLTMHSISGGPQGDVRTPYESLTLAFDKIEWNYFPAAFEPTREAAAEVRAGWSAQEALATA